MNKIGKSFALCASVATTFMHGSAEKIYKSHILRTATITRTSSTRSLTHVGRKTSTQNLSKKRLWSGARSLRSVQDPVGWSCGITNISQDLSVQDLCPIACVTLCYAKTVRGSRGHVRCMLCRNPPCKIDVHVPFLATWNNASTMRQTRRNHDHFKSTQSTHATQNNENILAAGMHNPCKAAQLNHIDRCDRTSSCIHFPYSPHRDHALWRNYFGDVKWDWRWTSASESNEESSKYFEMISQTSDPPDSHPQNSHSQTSHLYRLLAHTLLTHRLLTNRLQYT